VTLGKSDASNPLDKVPAVVSQSEKFKGKDKTHATTSMIGYGSKIDKINSGENNTRYYTKLISTRCNSQAKDVISCPIIWVVVIPQTAPVGTATYP